jgi:hypothetical protein
MSKMHTRLQHPPHGYLGHDYSLVWVQPPHIPISDHQGTRLSVSMRVCS